MDFVWLRHPGTGGVFRCPAVAVDAWLARGWEPGDEPAEPDTLRDPAPTTPPADTGAMTTPATGEATPPTNRTRRAPAGASTEE